MENTNVKFVSFLIFFFVITFNVSCKQKFKELNCATEDSKLISENSSIKQPYIFKAKCAACHMIDKNTTGPKLYNILSRVPSEKWFDEFVKNEDSLKEIKDEYTIKIEKYSPVDFIHNFKDLNEIQLQEIKRYLNQK